VAPRTLVIPPRTQLLIPARLRGPSVPDKGRTYCVGPVASMASVATCIIANVLIETNGTRNTSILVTNTGQIPVRFPEGSYLAIAVPLPPYSAVLLRDENHAPVYVPLAADEETPKLIRRLNALTQKSVSPTPPRVSALTQATALGQQPSTSTAAWSQQLVEPESTGPPLVSEPNRFAEKLSTDPNLEVPESHLTEEEKALCKEYRITEPTLTDDERRRLIVVLQKHDGILARKKWVLGAYNLVQHHIETGDAPPIWQNPYRMPYFQREMLREELENMEKADIIEKASSPWAAPVVYVPKKESGQWRLCIDFRKLNSVAKTTAYPLPRIGDIFDTLEGNRYFTSLDLACGFWQIELDEESRPKAAFNTIYGQYRFRRLPFGLATAPGTFQKVMNAVLSGLNWIHCMVYVDDIIIFSRTMEEHITLLDKVLSRVSQANLMVKLKKCEFARTQLHYLGHVLNSKGRHTDPKKVEAVRDMPPPAGVQELETFLGKVGYYQAFIKDYADLTYPLNRLRRKNVPWEWTELHQRVYERLKELLCSAPVLRHPDFERPFVLQTDASGYGLGAVLSQHFADGEHPVAYAARTLQPRETRWATIEKEALGVYWGIHSFRQYLQGQRFLVETDHKPLTALQNIRDHNTRLHKIAMKLQGYEFDIAYRPGIANQNADLLSRRAYPVITREQEKAERAGEADSSPFATMEANVGKQAQAAAIIARRKRMLKPSSLRKPKETSKETDAPPGPSTAPVVETVPPEAEVGPPTETVAETVSPPAEPEQSTKPVAEPALPAPVTGTVTVLVAPAVAQRTAQLAAQWDNLPQLQLDDPWSGPIIRYLTNRVLPEGDADARALLLMIDQYALENGILLKSPQKLRQICLPLALRPFVLHQVHAAPAAGHLGNKKTYNRLIQNYYWPRCYDDCLQFVKECRTCALSKPPVRNHRQEMGQRPRPQNVWQTVHMDIWVPGSLSPPPTARGNTKVLALVDVASKYVVLRPVPNQTKEVLADVLANDIFPQYGAPLELISDRGGGFISALQGQMLAMFGVTRQLVLPHHPRANGQVERFFRVFRSMLTAVMVNLPERYQHTWDEYIHHAAYAYNTSIHRSTGATPFFLFHGHHPETILHEPIPAEIPDDTDAENLEWLEIIADTRLKAFECMEEEEAKNRRRFNTRANPQAYLPGDAVFLKYRISPGKSTPNCVRSTPGLTQ
jgi:hypothetical protein